MTEPLTDEQLAEIEARYNRTVPYTGGRDRITDEWMKSADTDRGQLLAEVKRQREIIDAVRAVVKEAEDHQGQSFCRMFGGQPFPAVLAADAIRTALGKA